MTTEKVFLIYVPYLNEKLYYVCNSEWTFEPSGARFFVSEEHAQMAINRLKTIDIYDLNQHCINPNDLSIKVSDQETQQFIHISV